MNMDSCIKLCRSVVPSLAIFWELSLSEQASDGSEVLDMCITSAIVQHIIVSFHLFSEKLEVEARKLLDRLLSLIT